MCGCVCPAISDIDECALDSDGCGQTCTNTEGSYVCSCGDGFMLDEDGRGCSGEEDVEGAREGDRALLTPTLSLSL